MKINKLLISLWPLLLSLIMAFKQERQVDIVFIGDSITFGAGLKNA